MAIIEIDVQDFLPLGQGDTHTPKALTINQPFGVSDLAKTQIQFERVAHLYSPAQQATIRRAIANLSVTDYFIMYQQGAKTHFETVIDIFFMWQEGRPVFYEEVIQALTFVQTVSYDQCKGAANTLTFTHAAIWKTVRSRTLISTFAPVSRATLWQPNKYKYSIDLPTLTGPNAPEC
jgi:hypothetical protein